jgi:MCP family monocarboxylic acid transporter-like MFS transporter 10
MAGRFGVIEVFIACGVAGGISVLALWSSRAVGTAGTIIGLYLYGLFGGLLHGFLLRHETPITDATTDAFVTSGAVIALVAACCAQISPVREFGLRLGMMWTVASLPLLAGPQLAGLLVQKEGGYTGFSLFSGITIIAGSLLAFAPVMWKRYRSRRQRILNPGVVQTAKA